MMYKDQMGREVSIPKTPKRIVSLVPSQTELLVDLGLRDQLVGVTKFCVHPASLRKEKTIVGGTKNYRFDVIDELKPDLIIGNKEENDQEGIEKLSENYPVWMSDVGDLSQALAMISAIGMITGKVNQAKVLVEKLEKSFAEELPKLGTVVYLIWNSPIMAVGKSTFIHEMLGQAGFINAIDQDRYPEISMKELKRLNPDFLFLSSEPFPFKSKHVQEFEKELPKAKVRIVDGEMFSWYGSRLLKSQSYFDSLRES
ncbi:MAG: ABC-type Fe3+-hydroxamate transport system, periplasmic component [Algoriphagus marincola HL-49]|uniref:ABC-type Fe3+-hydroxamate transport system, periplasmic component n=1 Tax=Algoriphagus marincola HL-49 TaxID=1305737 RepID=A0A0P8BMS4_9BACT|nr:MAG: ABC-type Fe3+-hydroxamate transport system, periplasmic component [Algoriphagus marincola HL-49]